MMRYFELCDKSLAFAQEIMETSEFKELLELKDKINNDASHLVEEFNRCKLKYEEVSKYSMYHPDYKKTQLSLVKAKEALYTNPLVKRYKELEKIIQEKLNDVAHEIAKTISANCE